MSLLLCFSGQIGSGKSSVSAAVAEALGWRRTGFGDYLRSEITLLGGNPDSREALQDLGQRRVDEDPKSFCRDVLTAGGFKSGDNFIVDGVRHVSIFDILVAESKPTTRASCSSELSRPRALGAFRRGTTREISLAQQHTALRRN
jgi:hypothetical protein